VRVGKPQMTQMAQMEMEVCRRVPLDISWKNGCRG
jgi:hypothetical protein